MADKKIIDLVPLVTQASSDLYETSANGTGSFKETRAQMAQYMRNNANLSSVVEHDTSVTLTGSEIVNGLIRTNPASSTVVLTLPSAADIYAAMGSSSVVGSYVDCYFINISIFPVNLSDLDATLIYDAVSLTIQPGQTTFLRFHVTQITPSIQITVDGGNELLNMNTTGVYVNGSTGLDSPGYGSSLLPYATISYATSQITDASPTKPYTLIITGDVVDNGQVYLSPNINVFATSPDITLTNSIPIAADPAWATASIGFSYSYWQNLAIYGSVDLDFSGFSSSIVPFIQFIQTYFEGGYVTVNGNPSTSGFPNLGIYFYQCYVSFGLMIDNAYVYGADNQIYGALNLGIGTPTSCVNWQSSGDTIYPEILFQDNNPTTSSPYFYTFGSYLPGGIACTNGSNTPSVTNVILQSCNLGNVAIGNDGTPSAANALTVTVAGCNQIPSLDYSDFTGSGTGILLNIDANSFPASISGGITQLVLTTNVESGISTDNGFCSNSLTSGNPSQFSWTGSGFGSYTLLAGRGAHVTGGTDNIMLGKSATTNWIGTFMFADSTNSSGGAYFPQGNNQVIFNAAGGFGIGNNSNTGTLGPQAGFHYANYNGNDGNFLFSGAGAVVSANMNILEINPYVSANTLAIQYTGSTGTAFTVTFPSGGGTVPTLAGNQTWTGFNVYSQPIISSSVGLFATVFTLYSGSVTLAPADMIGGTIIANSVGAASFQMPTFTSFDAAMATFFNQTIPVNSLIFFTIENINSGAITLTPNTGFTILTENGAPVAAPFKSASYRAVKASSSSYTLYGS